MFGEPRLNIEELDTSVQQKIREEALATEVKSIEKGMGVSHPPGDETRIIVSKSPDPSEIGIPEGMILESEGVKEKDPKNLRKFVTRFYYMCKLCNKRSQNRASMLTHAAYASKSI